MSRLAKLGRARKGMVLIVVLSVLAVMAIMGVTFVTLNSLDRKVSNNWLMQVQARLIARAGLEEAASRLGDGVALRTAFDPSCEWQYGGRDIDGKDPSKRAVPLKDAIRPSFAMRRGDGAPEQISILRENGQIQTVGYSGTMAGRDAYPGSIYGLEIRDLSACIYVNDGVHLHGGNQSSVSQNLKRILNALGLQLGLSQLGDTVVGNRPARGFQSWQDFKTTVQRQTRWTDEQFAKLERYLTVHAWLDKNVANPVPLSKATLDFYPVKYERGEIDSATYRRGPGKNYKNEDRSKSQQLGWAPDFAGMTGTGGASTFVYGMDELNPTYVEIVHRAPVNVNTAEEPVLVALLAGLKGVFVMEKRSGAPISNSPPYMDYTGVSWLPSNFQFTVPQTACWEYMGHTYDDNQWPAQVKVVETKDWKDAKGASAGSTTRETKEMIDHDAIGQLWITPTIVAGSAETMADGIAAKSIAQEIIQCRNRQGDYAALPFAGPFRNWAQFAAFCDHLVTTKRDGSAGRGILRDARFNEPHQRVQAEQALADLLKANFNPNLTPNELNPDHNLYQMIDKTDLVVNSTEFCFLPTGYFSITSLGRILAAPQKAGKTVAGGAGLTYSVVSSARIQAVAHLHDCYRETNQRHFYLGDFSGASDAWKTNNACTVECGPEADNGPLVYGEHFNGQSFKYNRELDGWAGYPDLNASIEAGWGYETAGYLGLPTTGGNGRVKPKNTLWKAIVGPASPGVTMSPAPVMRASFRLDDRLEYSQSQAFQVGPSGDIYRENAASLQIQGDKAVTTNITVYNPGTCSATVVPVQTSFPSVEKVSDYPDPGEENTGTDGGALLGPYEPNDGTRFREVRSYRLPLSISKSALIGQTVAQDSTTTLPKFKRVPPSDLRVDGFYSERHTGLAYWLDEEQSFDTRKGTVCFWFKPNFDPAFTGKVRSVMSVSRVHRKNYWYRNPSPFTLFMFPAAGGSSNPNPAFTGTYSGGLSANVPILGRMAGVKGLSALQKASLVFGTGWSRFDGTGWDGEWKPPITTWTPTSDPIMREMEWWASTPTVNGLADNRPESDKEAMRARRWSHVTVAWNLRDGNDSNAMAIMVNGRVVSGTLSALHPQNFTNSQNTLSQANPDIRQRFALQSFMDDGDPDDCRWYFNGVEDPTGRVIANTLRLGEGSTHSFNNFPKNYSSDGTYDELFVWTALGAQDINSLTQSGAKSRYREGRYYVPNGGAGDALWTSPELLLVSGVDRELPAPSGGTISGTSADRPKVGATQVESKRTTRLLGVSWTWYAEKYIGGQAGLTGNGQQTLIPVMVDYRDADNPKELRQSMPCARLFVKTAGQRYPLNNVEGYTNDGFSPVEDSEGKPLALAETNKFQYQVQFKVEGAVSGQLIGSVLLSSPMFDDATFYFEPTGPKYIEYFQYLGIE